MDPMEHPVDVVGAELLRSVGVVGIALASGHRGIWLSGCELGCGNENGSPELAVDARTSHFLLSTKVRAQFAHANGPRAREPSPGLGPHDSLGPSRHYLIFTKLQSTTTYQ